MKQLMRVLMALFILLLLSATTEAAAGGESDSPSEAVITFDDAAQAVHLTIPTPACPESEPQCEWKFFLNEPRLHVDVATVYGSSGSLTIEYPSDFCGVIQADAYVGPPWVAKRGFQHTIEDCEAATATTLSTGPPSAGATSEPPTTATTAASTPLQAPPEEPAAAATAVPPAAAPAAATAATAPVGSPAGSTPAQLPFTGSNIKPFLVIGWSMVAVGVCLLIQRRRGLHSRRRYRHQARPT